MAGHDAIATESFAGTHGGRQRMRSVRSRVLIFAVRNRHLLKASLRPEVITEETDTNQLREQFEQGARRMGSVPLDTLGGRRSGERRDCGRVGRRRPLPGVARRDA
jgi:hypothetical protein